MAVVTSDFLSALFTGYHIVWEQAFLAASSRVAFERYTYLQPSTTDTETYAWLGTVPQMREFIDTRAYQSLLSYNYSIKNRKWELTIGVDRTTIDDDRYNMIRPRIAQMGQEAARYPALLAAQTLVAGTSTTGYDGVNFFATTHVEGSSGTQSNNLTGTGTTLSAVRADLISARTAMRRFKDDQGRPMNLQPDLVVIPPDLQDVFEQLINTNIIALSSGTQQSNVLMGAVDIMVDANLTDLNDWFLLDTGEILKPLVYQLREPAEFTARERPDDPKVFDTDQYAYGVRARFSFGYMLWQTAIHVSN